MPIIKRYPNRKLYDTEAKQYITLEGVATLIRQGGEVQVLDHATGEDLTAVTLTQVIFEQEKKRSGFLPQSVLTGLIQSGGETMGTLRRTLASSLNMARHVDEEIERRMQILVNRGEVAAEEGRRLRDRLLAQGRDLADTSWLMEKDLSSVLAELGVPTHDEMAQILDQLDELAAELDSLRPDGEPPESR